MSGRCRRALAVRGIDYLDLKQLYWLGRGSAWTEATVAELVKLKEEGKVRARSRLHP